MHVPRDFVLTVQFFTDADIDSDGERMAVRDAAVVWPHRGRARSWYYSTRVDRSWSRRPRDRSRYADGDGEYGRVRSRLQRTREVLRWHGLASEGNGSGSLLHLLSDGDTN